MKLSQKQVQHLYLRAGFGESYPTIQEGIGKTPQALTKSLFASSEAIDKISIISPNTELIGKMKTMSNEAKKQLKKDARNQKMDLNIMWLSQMVNGNASLREKMTLFWHDHFASESKNPYFAQRQNNLLRQHALGNFKELLFAVSKDQVMLKYLNNQQNKKQQPNENFAREVMELFTLGRGNYTENDIKEAARAFTGWGFNKQGDFVFRSRVHDYGEKTIFGKTGNFDGKDVLNMLLANKQTARYLSEKLYCFFVNPTPNTERIEILTDVFFSSDYDISKVLDTIFTADWFYASENIGTRIKSPIEFLANLQKTFGIQFEEPLAAIFIQKALGQVLFQPPNVAGWPNDKGWIDSSTLMFRLKFPEIIFKSHELSLATKESGDAFDALKSLKRFRKIQAKVNWEPLSKSFKKEKQLATAMRNYLIQTNSDLVFIKTEQTDLEEQIKELAFNLTRLPDFQLC